MGKFESKKILIIQERDENYKMFGSFEQFEETRLFENVGMNSSRHSFGGCYPLKGCPNVCISAVKDEKEERSPSNGRFL